MMRLLDYFWADGLNAEFYNQSKIGFLFPMLTFSLALTDQSLKTIMQNLYSGQCL